MKMARDSSLPEIRKQATVIAMSLLDDVDIQGEFSDEELKG